ncbi:MAG: pyridoxal-dependent decarboxylase, partial [Sphingomonadales bacterium]
MFKTKPENKPELTLDPENWEEFRKFAHNALDEALSYVSGVRERPPWKPVSEGAKKKLSEPLPVNPTPVEAVFDEFKENIFPYPLGNIHPRHWGWVNGSGTAEGIVAEMLAATMNSNITSHDQSPIWVEKQVLDWFRDLFDFPESSGGLLVSGGTMANLT